MALSLDFPPDAAACTDEAQRTAAERDRALLPFLEGWQPLLVRPRRPVLHAVIHICRTLDLRVGRGLRRRRDCPAATLEQYWRLSRGRRDSLHRAYGIVSPPFTVVLCAFRPR